VLHLLDGSSVAPAQSALDLARRELDVDAHERLKEEAVGERSS
jgi:hypothetical protein